MTVRSPFKREEFIEHLKAKFLVHARLRSRPVGTIDNPYWEEVSAINWDYHVREQSMSDEKEIYSFIGKQYAIPFDLNHPQWIWWTINLENKEQALVCRVSHMVGDGSALLELFNTFLDIPEESVITASSNRRAAKGSILMDSFKNPLLFAHFACNFVKGVYKGCFAALMAKDTPTAFSSRDLKEMEGKKVISVTRPFCINQIKEIKHAVGGTVNDVLLSIVTSAFRKYLEKTHDKNFEAALKEGKDFRLSAAVLYDTRDKHHKGVTLGNDYIMLFLQLPVMVKDRVEVLETLKQTCDDLKMSPEKAFAVKSTRLGYKLFSPLKYVNLVYDLCAKYTIQFTSVNGPSKQVTLFGREVTSMNFTVCSLCGLVIGAYTYDGNMRFTVLSDDIYVKNLDLLTQCIEDEFERFRTATAAHRAAHVARGSGARGVRPAHVRDLLVVLLVLYWALPWWAWCVVTGASAWFLK